MTTAHINRIATAVPEHEVYDSFVVFAENMLEDPRLRSVFRRMASPSEISHRHSFLNPHIEPECAMAFGPGLTAETMRFHVV
ncbi:hypothetical protein [Terriglobus saanensis]|uniref:Globin n=1 Tax=Terriglobus saanensis (strain ATCC BAA-1853 / DSM 23119 / SP1PR4) TaxID=401053 RepID=E8V490_TERSS|nr:hypothetical protein [Terriglobus saanensis]ADV83639.1 hypothetical protein AciPR4_2872 [Terriglobus saanensis SP1PR4]